LYDYFASTILLEIRLIGLESAIDKHMTLICIFQDIRTLLQMSIRFGALFNHSSKKAIARYDILTDVTYKPVKPSPLAPLPQERGTRK
jgi:hypothetical protein